MMGMIGYYYALEDAQIKQLADGEIVLEQLDPADSDVLNIGKSCKDIHYLLGGAPLWICRTNAGRSYS